MTAAFPFMHTAADTVVDILANRVVPTALEFMDKHCIRAVDHHLKIGLNKASEAFLLIEVDGFESELSNVMAILTRICKKRKNRSQH